MTTDGSSTPAYPEQMTGLERLNLRASAMINHPVAQMQRWVTIHRLHNDGKTEWATMLETLGETPELALTLNDDDSVTVRWERRPSPEQDDFSAQAHSTEHEDPPF